MAKFHFRYGAMNAGKSTVLLQTAYNYEEKGKKVVLIKPSVDTKGDEKIVSRIGLERKVDYLISDNDSIISKLGDNLSSLSCILVDEAQFLKRKQVDELFYISKIMDIPVIAFGLRTDFKSNGFEGSIRLLELADALEEIRKHDLMLGKLMVNLLLMEIVLLLMILVMFLMNLYVVLAI